ncbi:hypothetical protein OZX74_05285 [Bifidobacterium sp. ESL0798]|uniref:hypothetical protein n=1 Tax=Bifidobacterium sp. ESL0798 TaxID=2983235 RepID=UPI0023F91E7C|nr:hypothetical protein [Bifidobacterium sp. ESL0798]WEV73366.1 hypothetical protein OZX74_05285 [Bifidobacterium sp. ESL0798]
MSNFAQHLHDFASSSGFSRFVERAGGIAHRVNTMVGSGVSKHDVNDAVPALSARSEGKNETSTMMQELLNRSIKLGPMIKRRIFEDFPNVPDGLSLGWAQLPQLDGRFFALGVFLAPNEFCQVALVDGKGRVFLGETRKWTRTTSMPHWCSARKVIFRFRMMPGCGEEGPANP